MIEQREKYTVPDAPEVDWSKVNLGMTTTDAAGWNAVDDDAIGVGGDEIEEGGLVWAVARLGEAIAELQEAVRAQAKQLASQQRKIDELERVVWRRPK